MKLRRHLLLFVLFVLGSIHMNAQETWQHISGIPCEETSSVIQDGNGYIWIGTRLGLVRYDGYNVQMYRNDMDNPHAFSSCNILSLATDGAENIFAGSFFGLNTFHLPTRSITATHFEGEDHVKVVFCDSKDRLWIGTDNGLYWQSKKTDKAYFNSIPHDGILCIIETRKGEIVVVSNHNGIFVIDAAGKCTPLRDTADIMPRVVFADRAGTLWIGTARHGLYSISSGIMTKHDGYDRYVINDIADNASHTAMLLATDRGVVQHPAQEIALEEKNVQKLYRDRDGNVWASTEGQGIYMQRNYRMPFKTISHPFTHQTTPIISQFDVRQLADTVLWKGIPYINAIYENGDGTTFIGTWNNGLYVTRQGKVVRHLTVSDTPWLNDNSIYSLCTLSDGGTLIATWHGFYLMDSDCRGKYVGRIGKSDISNMHILSVYAVTDNDVWMGLVGGIAHIRGNLSRPEGAAITVYTHVNSKGRRNPDNVAELTDRHDEEGEYQLGGIYRIVRDEAGRIWACTSEPGLLLYDAEGDVFRSVSREMGIRGDNVHSMDIALDGSFWMTTNYGILHLCVDKRGKVTRQRLYSGLDGLPASYYGSTMSTRLADGGICFLDQTGMVVVEKGHLPMADGRGTGAFISDIVVNGEGLAACRGADIDALPPHSARLTLPHDQNNLSIYFSALSFGQEASMRFAYMLEGVDEGVRLTDMGANGISYRGLAPGTYSLRYCVADWSEEWPEGGVGVLTIEVRQPLWWRWWARALYALVAVLAVGAVAVGVVQRSRRRRRLAELEMERRRLDELCREKTRFYVRVVHEFMTPLTLMREMIQDLHSRVRPSLQAPLFMLSNHADRLMEAMGNIVNPKEDASAMEAMLRAREMTRIDRDFLRRCTESVGRHIGDAGYSHRVMMEEVGASHATLYRKLKALTGMDATSFIRSIRMRAACQMLAQEPDIRIGELAERLGYDNPKYFSTCFRSEFGISPSEYRRGGGADPEARGGGA